jgi:hypothetical protein
MFLTEPHFPWDFKKYTLKNFIVLHQGRRRWMDMMIIVQLFKLESFTTSKTDRHLLRQKVRQKISVIKTNTFDNIKKIVNLIGILLHNLS